MQFGNLKEILKIHLIIEILDTHFVCHVADTLRLNIHVRGLSYSHAFQECEVWLTEQCKTILIRSLII